MAEITYNTGRNDVTHVYRATSGGTVFSANLLGTAFDYFLDSPSVDDAIYFCTTSSSSIVGGIELDVGTALVGTDVVLKWEYWAYFAGNQWRGIPNLTDPTNGFTVTGTNQLIRFPYPPFSFRKVIEGTTMYYVYRCRLVSFTSITEGGQNTTATTQFSNGMIQPKDYTAVSPATLADIYTYMNTNYPEVGMTRLDLAGHAYFIPHTAIDLSLSGGYLKMSNNIVLIGNGGEGFPVFNMQKLTDGEKVGTDKFRNGSKIVVLRYQGYTFSSESKLYGTQISLGTYKQVIDGITYSYTTSTGSYLSWIAGEYIGVMSTDMGTGYWYAVTIKNCFLNTTFNVTYPFVAGSVLENVHLYTSSAIDGMIGLYSGTGTDELKGLNWYVPTGSKLFVAQSLGADSYQWNFLNPSPAFPAIGADPNYMSASNPTQLVKNWHIYERYTLDLKVQDKAGTAISGATVTIVDKDGTAVTGSPFTTDASGNITQAKCLKSHGYYDTGTSAVKKDEYNPYTATITKSGYITKTIKYTMDRKREEIEGLEQVLNLNFSKHATIKTQ